MAGRLKPIKPINWRPLFSPLGRPADPCAQAKCSYCGRYGPLGSCAGCGAPNTPQRLLNVSTFSEPHKYLVVPAFDRVKR